MLPTPVIPAIEVAQIDPQYRRLQRVQAPVEPLRDVVVLPSLPVVSQGTHGFSEFRVVGDHGATVTERAEVLGRVEAERSGVSQRPGRSAAVAGSMCLAGVFDHQQAMDVGTVLIASISAG